VILQDLIKQDRFDSAGHEAILNVVVTASWFGSELSAVMGDFGVTPAQYNVLRILAGTHPNRVTCSEIASRLLDRTPDVTRLLNRLDKAHLVNRSRSRTDRRVVRVGINPAGLDLLERMAPVVSEFQERVARHLSEAELRQVSELLGRLRTDQRV
jgi:DNA-binding MarR family transcriptional regulator